MRKLEFLLGEAVEAGADTVITLGALQSNHARLTAAATARLGLRCELVLYRSVPRSGAAYEESGNMLLDRLFGPVIYTATRPVLARHHRTLYVLATTAGAAVYTLTVTLGTVFFSGEPLWWGPSAILCAMPFFVIGILDRKAARTFGARP
ncbi:hypothetical protein [Streptomyces sp. NPDC093097]|uniref:hypothetical protein n=1 Tax=Streptomyces sp. NPDC093097 TaxID=3366027 RepID=UPI00381183EF